MFVKDNPICKLFGHKYFRVENNRLYYIEICTRCGHSKKVYHNAADASVKK